MALRAAGRGGVVPVAVDIPGSADLPGFGERPRPPAPPP